MTDRDIGGLDQDLEKKDWLRRWDLSEKQRGIWQKTGSLGPIGIHESDAMIRN
jgi:hypothetical protein